MKKIYLMLFTCAMTSIGLGQNPATNYHFRLRATIQTSNYHTDFYFNNNSSSGLDRGYDASVFNSTAPSKAIYSKLVDGSYAHIDFAIQSLASEFLQSDTAIPLGVNVPAGQQVVIGMQDSNLESEVQVFLEDTETGVTTLLNNNTYSFTPTTTLNSAGRFNIRFTGDQTALSTSKSSLDSLQIISNTSQKSLVVKGQLTEATHLAIYDLQGRLVHTTTLDQKATSNYIDVSHLSSGVYLVRMNTPMHQKTQRVLLK